MESHFCVLFDALMQLPVSCSLIIIHTRLLLPPTLGQKGPFTYDTPACSASTRHAVETTSAATNGFGPGLTCKPDDHIRNLSFCPLIASVLRSDEFVDKIRGRLFQRRT